MNVFCVLAILVIYLSFENPDLYITDRGPAFNTRALTDWLDDPLHRRDSRILGFAIRNYNAERSMYGGTQMDQGLGLIISWMVREFPQFLLFYLRGGNFAIAGPEDADWEGIRRAMSERFRRSCQAKSADLYLNVTYVEISLSAKSGSSDRIVNTLIYALDEAGDSSDIEQTLMPEESLQEIDRQIEIKRWLDKALDNDTVEVFLQPIVDSRSHRVVSAEALARLRNEDGELIPPGLFIPIAEKNGNINLLGEQVLRKVCEFIRDHDVRSMGLHWININLSPIQCMHSNLPRLISSILEEYGVSSEMIHLEITEESMINFAKQEHQIENLLKQGFHFALDDYGSGFSNLHQVKKIAFSNIKLDMGIVWDYVRDRDQMLPALVQAFRQTGFSITAEGIETPEKAADTYRYVFAGWNPDVIKITGDMEYIATFTEEPLNGFRLADNTPVVLLIPDKDLYWYENGIRQGVFGDKKNIWDTQFDKVERGREIYDPRSDAWYWLDACYDGAVAKNKEVWMPYIYQDEEIGSTDGKWVRYDKYGRMIKGWFANDDGVYYYDLITGEMYHGDHMIHGKMYSFDAVTGIMKF